MDCARVTRNGTDGPAVNVKKASRRILTAGSHIVNMSSAFIAMFNVPKVPSGKGKVSLFERRNSSDVTGIYW